ncbi:MAG: glucuronyl esterase domain-containing protein, partial [Mobilitalea sp.]
VGAGFELSINSENSIMTGVSRWGKAAAVAGAFDKRIKVTAPSCSGSGGMASFRYKSEGKTYDYSSIGISAPYLMTTNEPLSSLQSSSERHWFNDNFLSFKDINTLPFDQHLLAALCADQDRFLFITGSYLYEDWTNPPSMWVTYLAAKEVFEYLGVRDNIAIHIHKEGHMVTDEDMVYLLDFCDYHFYGKKVKSNLEDLSTSLYLEPANYDPIFDHYLK